jgi:hypothetical protein
MESRAIPPFRGMGKTKTCKEDLFRLLGFTFRQKCTVKLILWREAYARIRRRLPGFGLRLRFFDIEDAGV